MSTISTPATSARSSVTSGNGVVPSPVAKTTSSTTPADLRSSRDEFTTGSSPASLTLSNLAGAAGLKLPPKTGVQTQPKEMERSVSQGHSYASAPEVKALASTDSSVKLKLSTHVGDGPADEKRDFTVTVTGTGARSLTDTAANNVAGSLSKLLSLVTANEECKNFLSVKFIGGHPPAFAKAVVVVPHGFNGTREIVLGGRNPDGSSDPKDFCLSGNFRYIDAIKDNLDELKGFLTGSLSDVGIHFDAYEQTKEEIKKKEKLAAAGRVTEETAKAGLGKQAAHNSPHLRGVRAGYGGHMPTAPLGVAVGA